MITFSATYSHNGSCGDGPGVSVRGDTTRGGVRCSTSRTCKHRCLQKLLFVHLHIFSPVVLFFSFDSWGHEPRRRKFRLVGTRTGAAVSRGDTNRVGARCSTRSICKYRCLQNLLFVHLHIFPPVVLFFKS